MNRLNIYETGLPSLVYFYLLSSMNMINIASIFSSTKQLQSLQDFDYYYCFIEIPVVNVNSVDPD